MRSAPSHPRVRRTQRSSPSHRARAAFTLIEILIAIGIVVVMVAISTPAIVSAFGDRRIEAEAERLAAAMAGLRAQAVRQRATLALYLEPAQGEYGGELFIGPLEQEDDAFGFPGAGEEGEVPTGPRTASGEPILRTRSAFKASTPLTLASDQPIRGTASEVLGEPSEPAQASFAREPERIRIAVCTPSGQILASRPLWLYDERSMFRVEVGLGIGNAALSPMQIIPEADALEDGERETDPSQSPADPPADRPLGGPQPEDPSP